MSDETPLLPDAVEVAPQGEHRWSVIWLHGLGADGHDFEPIVPELRLPDGHGVRFLFPHAPQRPITIHEGAPARAWFDIADPDFTTLEDKTGIRQSIALAHGLLARERDEHGIPSERILLGGFSQGAAIALAAGLRYPERLGGIVALSGYLPMGVTFKDDLDPANQDTPIFQAHGSQDEIIAESQGEKSRDEIAAVRPGPEWHSYPMAHGVCAEEIQDLATWLKETVGVQ
ncbi:MAG: dienelactone hydrolase family protein [Halofilum sp. (in: g-proteobacteria)]